MMEKVKVGCCGFPRGMKHYFSKFRQIEVQQTFYKPPQIETVVKWRQAAPADFEFTIKAWQRTREIAQAVRARIILFQCLASFVAGGENIDHMRKFFQSLVRDKLLFAWEPRGEWSQEAIISLCQELNLIHCTNPLEMMPLHGAINYLRLHCGPGYRHSYTGEELEQLRQIIGDKESHILFNNITMYDGGLRFIKLLRG